MKRRNVTETVWCCMKSVIQCCLRTGSTEYRSVLIICHKSISTCYEDVSCCRHTSYFLIIFWLDLIVQVNGTWVGDESGTVQAHRIVYSGKRSLFFLWCGTGKSPTDLEFLRQIQILDVAASMFHFRNRKHNQISLILVMCSNLFACCLYYALPDSAGTLICGVPNISCQKEELHSALWWTEYATLTLLAWLKGVSPIYLLYFFSFNLSHLYIC